MLAYAARKGRSFDRCGAGTAEEREAASEESIHLDRDSWSERLAQLKQPTGAGLRVKCSARPSAQPLASNLISMALPSAYLTSARNLPRILEAIGSAQAPPRFTQRFLEGIGFSSNSDRLVINVFKALGFLSDTGVPNTRYHQYLDRSQSKRVLAEGVREAYSDLFQINTQANGMTAADVKNKMKTLSQGLYSDSVLSKMASTFKALCEQADFSSSASPPPPAVHDELPTPPPPADDGVSIRGLVYNINIHLPESRDPAVYDALFRSLKEHLR